MSEQVRQFFNMPQRSREWFACRKDVLSASEAGAALGLSPWKSPAMLLAEKAGLARRDYSDNAATRWGKLHEEEALMHFLLDHKFEYETLGFAVVDGWLGASPDGLLGDDGLIEIKTPYNQVRALKSIGEQPYYLAQIQVQLYCTDRQWCAFWQWRPHDAKLEIVQRDDEWLGVNIPQLHDFWQQAMELKHAHSRP